MLFRILTILCALNAFSVLGQVDELDSLKQRITIEKDERELGRIYSRLGWLHIVSDPSSAQAYIDSSLTYYESIGDSSGIANCLYRCGVLNRFVGNYEKADSFIIQNLKYYEARKDTRIVINAKYQQGVIYSLQGRYNKSLEAYFEILNAYKQNNDSTGMGFTLNSIGIVFKNMNNYEEAEDALLRSIAIHEASDDAHNLANAVGNLGSLYSDMNRYPEAMVNFRRAKEIDQELGIVWGEAINEMNIGATLMAIGKFEEALANLNHAHQLQESNAYLGELAETKANLGQAFLELNELDSARIYFEAGIAIDEKSMKTHADLLEGLAQVYAEFGEFEKASNTQVILIQVNDSIFEESNAKLANALAAEYSLDQKERQLAGKNKVIEEQVFELDKSRREKYLAIGVGGLAICLVLVVGLLYVQQKRIKNRDIENLMKQKEIASLESYIEGEENERARIARDLHDGLNGDLSVIKYKVASLNGKDTAAKNAVNHQAAIELIDRACDQVRSISHNLAPTALKNFSLTEALLQYVASISGSSSIDISFQHFGGKFHLSMERETVVFRMVQEMINNIVKHSKATEALIQLNSHDDDLVLTVEDNGKGFNPRDQKEGLGLKTIESRVAYLGAEYELNSGNQGTTYTVTIPLLEKLKN